MVCGGRDSANSSSAFSNFVFSRGGFESDWSEFFSPKDCAVLSVHRTLHAAFTHTQMLDFILGKDIASYVKRHRKLVVCSLVLTAISSLFVVVLAYLLQPFVDEGIVASGTREELLSSIGRFRQLHDMHIRT